MAPALALCVVLSAAPVDVEAVRGRSAWLALGGAALVTGGAVALGAGLYQHGAGNASGASWEVVGGSALLAFGLHVLLLAGFAALWPVDGQSFTW